MSSSADEGGAQLLTALFLIVFSLTFPLMFITLCGVSFVLGVAFHAPQFALWAGLASLVFQYATTNFWVAIALGVFMLAALPLAWVAFREQAIQLSGVIGSWVCSIIFGGGTIWLATVWTYNGNKLQGYIFSFLLLMVWLAVFEAVFSTVKLVSLHRANRPLPPPATQQPHGAANKPTNDPETI